MNTNVAVKDSNAELVEAVIAKGDFSKLTVDERNRYYAEVCKSAGLNPLTQPFAWITLNGKLTLYALKNATDQLRTTRQVSVVDMHGQAADTVYVVTVKVQSGDGRSDMATGAVAISNLKGEALANAMMKAETKAKRRATLSLCGLGFLDESEVETIPNARIEPASPRPRGVTPQSTEPVAPLGSAAPPQVAGSVDASIDPETGEVGPRTLRLREKQDGLRDFRAFGEELIACIRTSKSATEVTKWMEINDPAMRLMGHDAPGLHKHLWNAIEKQLALLKEAETGSEPWAAPPSS